MCTALYYHYHYNNYHYYNYNDYYYNYNYFSTSERLQKILIPLLFYSWFFLAMLITGGAWSSKLTELFDPLTKSSCQIQATMPDRAYHIQSKNIICGSSGQEMKNCMKLHEGTWVLSHMLARGRSCMECRRGFLYPWRIQRWR